MFSLKILQNFYKKYEQHIFLGVLGICVLSLGIVIGITVEKLENWHNAPGITLLPENAASEKIPLITLEKIENGMLFGKMEGKEARFLIGPDKAEIASIQNGSFEFSVVSILPNLKQIPAPDGMQFVASSRGSKFWPLDAPEAALITPKNRTFFRSAAEAEEKGFTKGK